MTGVTWLKQRTAWRHAQKVHQMEHENELPLTFPCRAVGHLEAIDRYRDLFDADQRRWFLAAGGGQPNRRLIHRRPPRQLSIIVMLISLACTLSATLLADGWGLRSFCLACLAVNLMSAAIILRTSRR